MSDKLEGLVGFEPTTRRLVVVTFTFGAKKHRNLDCGYSEQLKNIVAELYQAARWLIVTGEAHMPQPPTDWGCLPRTG
jgi:hypothetical protein